MTLPPPRAIINNIPPALASPMVVLDMPRFAGLLLACFLAPPLLAQEPAGPDWWSLQPLRRPAVPAGPAHPIDAFIQARLVKEGLRPAALADRRTLLRRLTIDLTGLPPTPAEIDDFLKDQSPDAYDKVVERLLASPHYGERMTRHWLDAVRFCETHGYEYDRLRDNAWRYRDYLIRAFNADKRYADFVREQVAGDVLPGATADSIAATGFLVAGPWDEVGQNQQSALQRKKTREDELEEMVGVVGQTFLGLTLNCARCHDHKFDPIEQSDYYQVKAALEGVKAGERPLLSAGEQEARKRRIEEQRKAVEVVLREVADLERAARQRAVKDRGGKPLGSSDTKQRAEGLAPSVLPIARWTFDGDARDTAGMLHGRLVGTAKIANGRLRLDGRGHFESAPLDRSLKVKTLEAWVVMPDRQQRGGGVLGIEALGGAPFDSIVFGERQPGKWMAGSEGFVRTLDLSIPPEGSRPEALIHVAITYRADGTITLYRNGEPIQPYRPANGGPIAYEAGKAHVLIGLRHTSGGNPFWRGEVEEARVYDRALTDAEVRASFAAGPEMVPAAEVEKQLTPAERERRTALQGELDKLRAKLADLEKPVLSAYAVVPGQPEPTFVLARGDVEKPRERVAAGGVAVLPGAKFGLAPDAPEAERRRKLADWLTAKDNPLPPRALVNRVWAWHFGRGIVGTPNDFGAGGEKPTHPELLDWLATTFQANGGSLKALHRLIVTSHTYRQAGKFDDAAAAKDAESRLLWRYPPRRIEGEAARDLMLAAAGRLNPAVGGPSYRPFVISKANSNFYNLFDDDRPEFRRRSLYRMSTTSSRDPLLEVLDCPDPTVKTPRRAVTTTPLQALALMNAEFVQRQSAALAARVAGGDLTQQVEQAYRLALGREPTADEAKRAVAVAKEHGVRDVAWALFNCNEFLTVR